MGLFFFILALIATSLGAIVGLGGGVLIRPVLDFWGLDVVSVGILSSLTVLTMAVVANVRNTIKKRLEFQAVFVAVGAVIGGMIANLTLDYLPVSLEQMRNIQIIFLLTTNLIVIFVVQFKHKFPALYIKDKLIAILAGVILGFIASFVGIGGGPLNIFVLYILFGMDAKRGAVGSVMIKLASLSPKLIHLPVGVDYTPLWFLIPGGIIGGYVGAYLNHTLSVKQIHRLFISFMAVTILLNLYNLATNLGWL